MATSVIDIDAEEQAFQDQILAIEKEWARPWRSHIKR